MGCVCVTNQLTRGRGGNIKADVVGTIKLFIYKEPRSFLILSFLILFEQGKKTVEQC